VTASYDTKILGDPGSCSAAATLMEDAAEELDEAEATLRSARNRSASWHGLSGVAFQERIAATTKDVAHVGDRLRPFAKGLADFAGELTVALEVMESARNVATVRGLTVTGTVIYAPTPPSGDDEAQIRDYNEKVRDWNRAVGIADGGRVKEAAAHEHLQEAIAKSTGDGFLMNLLERLGLAPPDYSSPAGTGGYLFGLFGLGAGTGIDYLVKSRYGVFQPRASNGQFGTAARMPFLERLLAARDADNFHAKPNAADARNAWGKAGRLLGHLGTGVTAGVSAWDQWQADADDPTMSDAEKGGRAGTMAATTAGGAWAGATLGGQGGAALGTAIFPGVGTVIGGAVGGLAGGAVGGFLGSEFGDSIKDEVGDIADAATDFIRHPGSSIAGAADALTFWD
jgi:uncharacterized protein YukE